MNRARENDPIIKEAHQKMMDAIKSMDDQTPFYATILACAKTLGDYILLHHDIKTLPREIHYMLVLTWNNYALVYSKNEVLNLPDVDFQDYFESGSLDDRFATVVKSLYDICKKENLL